MIRNRSALSFVALAVTASALSTIAQAETSAPEDRWAGTYRVTWVNGSPASSNPGDTQAVLTRAADADPAKVGKDADRSRWRLGDSGGQGDEDSLLRRFGTRDYADLGWADRHAAGTIECLEGRGLFLCRTSAGASVPLGDPGGGSKEMLPTRTGMFGVVLHSGAFELTRVR